MLFADKCVFTFGFSMGFKVPAQFIQIDIDNVEIVFARLMSSTEINSGYENIIRRKRIHYSNTLFEEYIRCSHHTIDIHRSMFAAIE